MINLRAPLGAPARPTRKLCPWIASTLPVALLLAAAAAPAARAAAVPEPAFTAYSATTGAVQAPRPKLRTVTYQPAVDAAAPVARLGQTLSVTRPHDGSTGLFIGGPISATVSGGTTDLKAGAIINETNATSGHLTLDLVATATPPPVGAFSGIVLATVDLGTLAAQTEISNFNSGSIAFTGPSAGCYYISLLLLENGDVADVRTLPAGGTPENTGYSEFGFGQNCPAASTCTRNANTVCLDGSRFQVTVAYDNTATGAGVGSVLLFGGTRAESDESGFYDFTDPSNFELGVKVLDACTLSNTFWVFIGGLTNQGWTLNVLDTQTHNVKSYGNVDGVTTVTTTDTTAFPCP